MSGRAWLLLVIAGSGAAALLTACRETAADGCRYTTIDKAWSADGKFLATAIKVDCGAAGAPAFWIAVSPGSRAPDRRRDVVAVFDDALAPDVSWDGEGFVVSYGQLRPRRMDQPRGVAVQYRGDRDFDRPPKPKPVPPAPPRERPLPPVQLRDPGPNASAAEALRYALSCRGPLSNEPDPLPVMAKLLDGGWISLPWDSNIDSMSCFTLRRPMWLKAGGAAKGGINVAAVCGGVLDIRETPKRYRKLFHRGPGTANVAVEIYTDSKPADVSAWLQSIGRRDDAYQTHPKGYPYEARGWTYIRCGYLEP